jgi:hypothetical protein
VREIPLDTNNWDWGAATVRRAEHLGRECVRLGMEDAFPVVTAVGVELLDGAIEADVAIGPEPSFHGVFWRGRDDANYESFLIRPHQVGNPDSIQYTPVFNGLSSWQLYHGPGFWNAIDFPIDEWFTIRVVFAGGRAEVFVAGEPALVVPELKAEPKQGAVGLLVGGDTLHVSAFRYGSDATLGAPTATRPERAPGVVPHWSVSDPFAEIEIPATLDDATLARRTWTSLDAEPLGLADLSRVNGITGGKDTVFARAQLESPRAQSVALELGFSDRAVVFLNGRRLYRGDDSYRSRDYRFLGSIGFYDTVYLPLEQGDNDLVAAVSESFGGWGIQARLAFGEAPEGAPPNIGCG